MSVRVPTNERFTNCGNRPTDRRVRDEGQGVLVGVGVDGRVDRRPSVE